MVRPWGSSGPLAETGWSQPDTTNIMPVSVAEAPVIRLDTVEFHQRRGAAARPRRPARSAVGRRGRTDPPRRGRRGRAWASPPGNLYASLLARRSRARRGGRRSCLGRRPCRSRRLPAAPAPGAFSAESSRGSNGRTTSVPRRQDCRHPDRRGGRAGRLAPSPPPHRHRRQRRASP